MLKSMKVEQIWELFSFWGSREEGLQFSLQIKDSRQIFIPTSFKESVQISERNKLKDDALKQLKIFRMESNKDRLSFKKRKHVQIIGDFTPFQTGFMIRKSCFKNLLKKQTKLFCKTELKQKIIEFLLQGERDPNKLSETMGISRWYVKKLTREVCSENPTANHKITKFIQKVILFRAIDHIQTPQNESFKTLKDFANKLKLITGISTFSNFTLYRVLRAKGFKYKPAIFYCNETENFKEHKIWF